MKILFARVGFMKFYQGPKPGDEKPIGGGSYNTDEIGSEAYNYLSINGFLYGYFQPHNEINLSRIEQGCTNDKIDEVLVIWFATNPIEKGQVVVGWYKNATVFRSIQSPDTLRQRENYCYNIRASNKDCVLLPISKRKFPVGHGIKGKKEGNPGQANAFYVLDDQGNPKDLNNLDNAWITKVVEYIENYSGSTIASPEDEIQEDILTPGRQGFQSDVEIRLMIESHAMNVCKQYYLNKGYKVEDVSATHSCDFIITKNGENRFIEVKGTQTSGNTIILTKNEVSLSREQGGNMILFIVHSIAMNKRSVKKNSGVISIIDPWIVSEEKLTPISFTYKI